MCTYLLRGYRDRFVEEAQAQSRADGAEVALEAHHEDWRLDELGLQLLRPLRVSSVSKLLMEIFMGRVELPVRIGTR